VRLAWKAPADDIRECTASLKDCITRNILDSPKACRIGKALVIDRAGEGLDLGVGNADKSRTMPPSNSSPLRSPPLLVFPPAIPSGVGHSVGNLGGKRESADTAEQVKNSDWLLIHLVPPSIIRCSAMVMPPPS
jgi:hypothetical protein